MRQTQQWRRSHNGAYAFAQLALCSVQEIGPQWSSFFAAVYSTSVVRHGAPKPDDMKRKRDRALACTTICSAWVSFLLGKIAAVFVEFKG